MVDSLVVEQGVIGGDVVGDKEDSGTVQSVVTEPRGYEMVIIFCCTLCNSH